MKDIVDLEQKLEKARTNLEEALRAKAEFDKLRPVERLAIELHDEFCTHNHSDQCDWYYHTKGQYRVPSWSGYAQGQYLNKAQRVMTRITALNNLTRELEVGDAVGIAKLIVKDV